MLELRSPFGAPLALGALLGLGEVGALGVALDRLAAGDHLDRLDPFELGQRVGELAQPGGELLALGVVALGGGGRDPVEELGRDLDRRGASPSTLTPSSSASPGIWVWALSSGGPCDQRPRRRPRPLAARGDPEVDACGTARRG